MSSCYSINSPALVFRRSSLRLSSLLSFYFFTIYVISIIYSPNLPQYFLGSEYIEYMNQAKSFVPFQDQRGHCVLIDLCSLSQIGKSKLCDSLKAVLRLNFLSDMGCPRIPYLAIYVWDGTTFLSCFSYQKVNVEYLAALLAVDSVLQTKCCHSKNPGSDNWDSFFQEIKLQTQSITDAHKKKADMVIFSSSKDFLLQMMTEIRSQSRSRAVSSVYEQLMLFHVADPSDPSLAKLHSFPVNDEILVNMSNLFPSSLAFDNVFRQWLQDRSVDAPQITLHFPPPTVEYLHCDAQEILMPPESLLFKNIQPAQFPVKNLLVKCRLPLSQFTHDLIYGSPLSIAATSCWKMDWHDLSRNDSLFKELCTSLLNNDEILILELQGGYNSAFNPFYALFPGKTTAILSPVVFRDILLQFRPKSEEAVESFHGCSELKLQIESLPMLDYFNPCIHAPRSAIVDEILGEVKKS